VPYILESRPIAASEHERAALDTLDRLLHAAANGSRASAPGLVGPNGEQIELPASVLSALRQVVHQLAQGKAVSVVPINQELTTQEAADILNVSRPYLVKLLEQGAIPFTRTGTHRRIRCDDLMAYKQQRDADRRRALSDLTQMSQDLRLYGA
jgi:excisionase family DNA binding protein